MIVRRHEGHTFCIRQPQHARHSAYLLACLRPEYIGDFRSQHDALLAARHHDDGWLRQESSPALDVLGLPVNFTELPKGITLENWRLGTLDVLYRFGPFAASLVALHAESQIAEDQVPAPAPPGTWRALTEALQARATAERGEQAQEQLRVASTAVTFADALSLKALVGWDSTGLHETLLVDGEPGRREAFTISHDGLWTLRIAPWPFAFTEITAPIDAVAIPDGSESHATRLLSTGGEWLYRIPVRILPG